MRRLVLISLVLAVAAAHAHADRDDAPRGIDIARQIDRANAGFKGETWNMEMVLINAQGDKARRQLKGKVRETRSDGDKTIMTFVSPPDVKDTRLLTWTHKRGDDDQWLFMPSLRRTKRIRGRNRAGSFMGSEFSYEDFNSQEVEAYRYKFIRQANVDGRPTWVLEQFPTKHESGYSRMVVWYDQEYMNPVRIKYYDRSGELLKTARFDGYERYRTGVYRPRRVLMVNKQTGKKSMIEWSKRRVGVRMAEESFSKDYLDE